MQAIRTPSTRLRRHSNSNERKFLAASLSIRCALFAALYLYLWLWLDPFARYTFCAPVFFSTREFLEPFLTRPGGLLEYVCAYLAQLDHFPALGALISGSLFTLLTIAAAGVLRATGCAAGVVWGLPAALALSLYHQYLPGVLELMAALLLAVGSVWGWLTLLPHCRTPLPRLILFAALAKLLFCLAGPGSSLLFVILGGVILWGRGAGLRSALFCWAWILPWLLAVWCLSTPLFSATAQWKGAWQPTITAWALFSCLPVLAFGMALWQRWKKTPARESAARCSLAWYPALQAALAIAAMAALLLTFNSDRRALLRIQSEAERQNWPGVLRAAAPLRETPAAARLQIYRALFHLGRLNSDLFSFPQTRGSELLASLADGLHVCVPMSDTLLELGHINLAERYAHEIMEVLGERPELLWRLAWINLIKERPEAARVFLNRLRKVPFHKARASRWLASINRDPTMAGEPSVCEARLRRVTVDQVERVFLTEDLLRVLLRPERPNRMAAEYLLAHFLLTCQADRVTHHIGLLTGPGSHVLPRHLEEAILAFQREHSDFSLPGWKFRPETVARLNELRRLVTQADRKGGATPALARDFGNTYWYYDLFGRSFPGASSATSRQRP